jgi:nucleobase:cation symporter-1, NCS1 family
VAVQGQVVRPDGRVELTPEADAALGHGRLHNEDLAPVPIEKRTWTTYNYFALWVGMAHNIPTWTLASGLVLLGMAWYQAVFTIMVANAIVLIPMLLNSHAGTKYGIPYPVFARASFGVFGANLPALIRAGVACGWFGIQTWIGGTAIFVVVTALLGANSWWATAQPVTIGFGTYPWTHWLSFGIFWLMNIAIIFRGMNAVRRFENWAAPFVIVVAIFLLIWMTIQAGGLGPLVEDHGKVGWGINEFWLGLFPPALMGMIAFWSTLSLNMPDFTRFGRSQREQAWGQALGLPTTMTFFPLIAVLVTSATIKVYGEAIWDPVLLVSKFDNPVVVFIALVTLIVATLSVNVAANIVSPSYDFSNLWPAKISFRTGGIITGVIGILIQPWALLANAETYIFTWLGTYGGATGAIAGVLIADYWWIRRTRFRLADLYKSDGAYRYARGWNWRAVVSLLVGIVLAIGGSYSTPGGNPFPADGIIPVLKPLADYSWVVGLVVSFVLYGILEKFTSPKQTIEEPDLLPTPEPAAREAAPVA